jgi:hypothetical protein
MMSKSMTQAEWLAEKERRKALAESKSYSFLSKEDWHEHNKNCSDCQITEKPYHFCEKSMDLHRSLAKSEWCKLPMAECVGCRKEWEEEDYGNIKEGHHLTCTNCGLIHEVVAVDWTIEVELKETGNFDPDYVEGEYDDE